MGRGSAVGSRRGTLLVLLAFVWTAVWTVAPPAGDLPGVEPAGATPETLSARCTEGSPATTWRVQFSADTGMFGRILRVTGLYKTLSGAGEVTAATDTWQLRRDWLPSENQDQNGDGSNDPFWERTGGLDSLDDDAMVDYVSPRLVTPDGTCTVYLSPFQNLLSVPNAPRVAVLGDTLTMLVSRSAGATIQGTVQANLNAAGISTEVEGTDWKSLGMDVTQTTPLAKANSYLMDEYRGLLDSDVDGFVVALGANDAFRVAAEPVATRVAKRNEVLGQFMLALVEMQQRSGCVAMVTPPEETTNVDLQTEIHANNEALRAFVAQNTSDSLELVDFAARAHGHRTTDPNPAQNAWFEADNLTLNARGQAEYAADLTRAAQLCTDTLVVNGAAGTFGSGSLVGLDRAATGQRVQTRAVPGWAYDGGRRPWWSTVTADDTILTGNMSHTGNALAVTGDDMVISAFNPDKQTFANVRLQTDRGVTHMTYNPVGPEGTPPQPLGFDLADLGTINGGNAAVFAGA
ncbi:MAG TPA: hypothetical protein VGO78_21230, partial [Acidimicrobiales bacterium]|nr:hypothetical protein [Acidimicrobiales bacterium]